MEMCLTPPVSSTETFSYNSPLQANQVRILTVLPAGFDDPVLCEISTESLDKHEPYDALSYCWGSALRCRQVWVGQRALTITKSVYEALKYLRRKDGSLRLWIDAVCINQEDIEEKNVQVQHMRQIYERATSTRVWLGPPHPDLPTALDAVVKCVEEPCTSQFLWDNYASIKDIICRSWFSRVWIVQEVALSPRCTLHCGRLQCDIWVFFDFVAVWGELGEQDVVAMDPDFLRPAGLKHKIQTLVSLRLMNNAVKRGIPMPLLQQLNIMRERECSDPHDYYYGTRAVDERLNDLRNPPIAVDYVGDVAKLLVEVTKRGLLEENGLTELVGCHRETGSGRKLPSWVPEWTTRSLQVQLSNYSYSAGGPKSAAVTEEMFTDNSLALAGFLVCPVRACYPALIGGSSWNSPEIDELGRWAVLLQPLKYSTIDEVIEALTRTLTTDIISRDHATGWKRWPPHDPRLRYRAWLGKYAVDYAEGATRESGWDPVDLAVEDTLQAVLDLESQFWEGFNCSAAGRVFAITQTGDFAICPPATTEADLVVVFPGVPTPFVLRPHSDGVRYEMIGPAYVHGIMDGQAMLGLEQGTFQLQTFAME